MIGANTMSAVVTPPTTAAGPPAQPGPPAAIAPQLYRVSGINEALALALEERPLASPP